jgi:hypothetical protein
VTLPLVEAVPVIRPGVMDRGLRHRLTGQHDDEEGARDQCAHGLVGQAVNSLIRSLRRLSPAVQAAV